VVDHPGSVGLDGGAAEYRVHIDVLIDPKVGEICERGGGISGMERNKRSFCRREGLLRMNATYPLSSSQEVQHPAKDYLVGQYEASKP
jgi:hypothetical protein